MTQLAVTLAAFTILFGTFLGFRFAQPIHVLAETAGKIADGQLDARTGLKLEDEVGLLARTFDQMADSLEEQVVLLREYRRFFDVSIDMLCIASVDGYFKKVNRAFVRELGWSEEELLARPFISLVHPDDVSATQEEIQKLSGGTPTIRFTNRFLCMDGSYKRVRWNSYPEAETGKLYAIARVRSDQAEQSGADGGGRPDPVSAASDAAAEAASREAV
jgi:PAS domain S-box-containing protein